jgi:hypothetical protein
MGSYSSGRARTRVYLSGLRLPLSKFTPRALHPLAKSRGRFDWSDGNSIGFEKSDTSLFLRYTAANESVEHRIGLAYLPRHFGGVLPVAVCPHCCRKVRVLYYARQGFICHRCTGAVYASTGRTATMRAQVRFQKLRERIRPGTWNDEFGYFPRRPKGMRRRTYARLKGGALAALDCYQARIDAGLLRLMARIPMITHE